MINLHKLWSTRSTLYIFLGLLLTHCTMVFSLATDNEEPLIINAATFEVDYTSGYARYSGNVNLQQGSRTLNSDQLYVYFEQKSESKKIKSKINPNNISNSSHNQIKQIKAIGIDKLVHYSEKLQNDASMMQAEAKIITLVPEQNLLTLEQKALITQNNKQLTSELLHYNFKTEVAYSPKVKNKRTKLILG